MEANFSGFPTTPSKGVPRQSTSVRHDPKHSWSSILAWFPCPVFDRICRTLRTRWDWRPPAGAFNSSALMIRLSFTGLDVTCRMQKAPITMANGVNERRMILQYNYYIPRMRAGFYLKNPMILTLLDDFTMALSMEQLLLGRGLLYVGTEERVAHCPPRSQL